MIVDPLVLLAYVPAALALNLTPGADMLFCLGQGLRSGARAAWAASAGISLGGMVHVTLAGLGLGAVMAAAPWLFDVVRWVGVGYLLWLAKRAFFDGPQNDDAHAAVARTPALQSFFSGFWVNLANPKVILFVLAFVPQFVDPARAVLPQFLVFGAVLGLGGLAINGLVGQFASDAGRKLVGSGSANQWLGRISGTIFAALALRLAILERS